VRDNGAVTSADPDAVSQADRGSAAGKRRRLVLFAAVAVAALGLDIVSKVLVAANLDEHPPVRLLGGAIYLVETRNSGAAFALGTGATAVLTVVALAVVAIILRTARRMYSIGWAVALGLILGGALGNIVDRLFREPGVGRGHVVDWISLFAGNDGFATAAGAGRARRPARRRCARPAVRHVPHGGRRTGRRGWCHRR